MSDCPGRSGTVLCKLKKGHAGYCWNGIRFDGGFTPPTCEGSRASGGGVR